AGARRGAGAVRPVPLHALEAQRDRTDHRGHAAPGGRRRSRRRAAAQPGRCGARRHRPAARRPGARPTAEPRRRSRPMTASLLTGRRVLLLGDALAALADGPLHGAVVEAAGPERLADLRTDACDLVVVDAD